MYSDCTTWGHLGSILGSSEDILTLCWVSLGSPLGTQTMRNTSTRSAKRDNGCPRVPNGAQRAPKSA